MSTTARTGHRSRSLGPTGNATGGGLRASHAMGFWFVAAAFTTSMAFVTVPTPLWPLYQARDHFGPTTVTIAFAVMVVGAAASLLTAPPPYHRHPSFPRRPCPHRAFAVPARSLARSGRRRPGRRRCRPFVQGSRQPECRRRRSGLPGRRSGHLLRHRLPRHGRALRRLQHRDPAHGPAAGHDRLRRRPLRGCRHRRHRCRSTHPPALPQGELMNTTQPNTASPVGTSLWPLSPPWNTPSHQAGPGSDYCRDGTPRHTRQARFRPRGSRSRTPMVKAGWLTSHSPIRRRTHCMKYV
jgi:hypothetical protein